MIPKHALQRIRFLCIHGHFYQPPRENPWLEAVEVQDSASPFHDWNERVTAECYAPNGAARILDGQQMVTGLLSNYAHMSFNVGPTLLAWLQRHAPDVAEGMREADQFSREHRQGHGNALAQPYNHTILPLDGERDRLTQVRWGKHVFHSFFGREPEGMWLPETAVDLPTLEALALEGIRFTVLAPHQAARIRPLGRTAWEETAGEVDTNQPYLCRLPSGREVALFFYNGELSRGVAFEGLLNDGEALYQRFLGGFRAEKTGPQLVHMATDGESYGHHHRFGEMALAYLLHRALEDPGVQLTNYGEFLSLHRPEWEVQIRERTSWSCVHGLDRWRSDCGCRTGGPSHWRQSWRRPLRDALNFLKLHLDRLFERHAKGLLTDPWAARDAYIQVILDRSPANLKAFWDAHRDPKASDADLSSALRLLEMERHGLLMFTSCGWFFDEISGLEATQILQYAARALQLAESLGQSVEADFLRRLEAAPSNVPEMKDGRGIWEMKVRPAVVDLDRVVAHCAIRSLFRQWRHAEDLYAFHVHVLHEELELSGPTQMALGRVKVMSLVTQEEADAVFGVVHFGGLDFSCFQRPGIPGEEIQRLHARILEAYRTLSVGDAYALMREHFPPTIYRLRDLFLDEQRHIVQMVLKDRFQDYLRSLELLAQQDLAILNHLAVLRFPIPKPLVMAGTIHVNRTVEQILEDLPGDGDALDRAEEMVNRSLPWGYAPDRESWGRNLLARLEQALEGLAREERAPEEVLPLCQGIVEAGDRLQIPMNLWRIQNLFIRACESSCLPRTPLLKDAEALARKLRLRESVLPWNMSSDRRSA